MIVGPTETGKKRLKINQKYKLEQFKKKTPLYKGELVQGPQIKRGKSPWCVFTRHKHLKQCAGFFQGEGSECVSDRVSGWKQTTTTKAPNFSFFNQKRE